ncbi:MAG: GNAT family N-acetyltransferase, partial [Glaciimonas sp.]|nr:GNAT family N-acetyltransferase [Glaciimonas sp.]
VVLAFDGDVPVGLVNCIEGFSTFACKPLLNIHDLAVVKSHRGQGIGRKLLEYVAEMAKGMGCCKVTLEVLEINVGAYALYKSCGFAQPEKGNTMYMQKKIT